MDLSSRGMLNPVQSASGLVGMGPNYTSQIVGSAYHFCKLAKECWCCEIEK